MIHSITKGTSSTIQRIALNNKGWALNLTGATITVTVKTHSSSTTTLFTKSSSSSSEIEVLNASKGIYLLKIGAANTSSLEDRTIYCLQTVVIGSNTYTDVFYIKLKGNAVKVMGATNTIHNQSGTTAQRPTLTSSDTGFEYYDTTIQAPVWWNGNTSEWSDE